MRRQSHKPKKETTRSVTFRLPASVVEELESSAENSNISLNVLVKQILEKYTNWDTFASTLGMSPVPWKVIKAMGEDMTGDSIFRMVEIVAPLIKEQTMFMKGKYDLKRCIETMEDYMRASGMKSDHRVEGAIHHFIIQHDLGQNWSMFTEQLLRQIIHDFLPDMNIKFQTSESTVIATMALGSDFSEHDY